MLDGNVSARRTTPEEKLGTFIRLLASERDGEVIAAARAIKRVLKSAGRDIHVLASHTEKMNGGGGALSEVEMKKILRRRLRCRRAGRGEQTARLGRF